MRKILTITFILILSSLKLLAYQPSKNIEHLQNESIKLSKLIFLGEIISSDSKAEKVTFRIFEKYKGNYNLDTVCVNYSLLEDMCFHPYNGLWLVYLEKAADSSFCFCISNLSRSLEHPEELFIWPYIEKMDKPEYDRNSARIDAVSDWFLELEKLKRLNKSESIIKKDNGSEKLITLSIIFSVVNFLILIYLLTKKNANR